MRIIMVIPIAIIMLLPEDATTSALGQFRRSFVPARATGLRCEFL
jgi:hypothetical protein